MILKETHNLSRISIKPQVEVCEAVEPGDLTPFNFFLSCLSSRVTVCLSVGLSARVFGLLGVITIQAGTGPGDRGNVLIVWWTWNGSY